MGRPCCRPTWPRPRRSRRATVSSRRARSRSALRSSRISHGPDAPRSRIERERRISDKVSTEVASIITSLTVAEAGPARLLDLSRGHWAIENRLHYVRDVSFNEDRCCTRAGGRVLATLRNLVLHLIRARPLSVPEARENFREDRAEAIAVVTGRIL